MLDGERRERILEVLRRETYASVRDLARATGASQTTVRRDLSLLESAGALGRIRGGAELSESQRLAPTPPRELPFETRRGIHPEEKRRIAAAAASLCEKGETIFIDGGSTTWHMVASLESASLTIVTNSFVIASSLVGTRNTIIIPAGIVYRDSYLILDPFGSDIFADYRASKAFMGVGGLSDEGAYNHDAALIRAERSMIEHADRLVLLADSSKLSSTAPLRLCRLESIDTLITDAMPKPPLREALLSAKVELVIVEQ